MTIFQDKTVAEYLLTEDRMLIDIILKNVKPKKVISFRYRGKEFKREPKINDLFEIKYKWILKMKEQLTSPTLSAVKDVLATVYDIRTDEQFYSCSVFDVFAAYAWIVEEVQNLYEIEKQKLFRKPTQKQIAAGIEEFDQLDDIPVIDALAGGDVRMWDEILELPYGQILRKLLLNKIQNEYNERYSKLK